MYSDNNLFNEGIRVILKTNLEYPKLLNVPHLLQSDYSTCGVICLKMVMAYYGKDISEQIIKKACNHTYELGCTSYDMANAAKGFGFDVYLKNNSSITELEYFVNNGFPVIIDWFCGDLPDGHSSVVVGINDEYLYIIDPLEKDIREISKEDFIRCWFDFTETPISKDNLYVAQIMVLEPKNI